MSGVGNWQNASHKGMQCLDWDKASVANKQYLCFLWTTLCPSHSRELQHSWRFELQRTIPKLINNFSKHFYIILNTIFLTFSIRNTFFSYFILRTFVFPDPYSMLGTGESLTESGSVLKTRKELWHWQSHRTVEYSSHLQFVKMWLRNPVTEILNQLQILWSIFETPESWTVMYIQLAQQVVSVLNSTMNKCRVQKHFACFHCFILLIKNTKPAHIPAITSLSDVACLTGHAKRVWTQDTSICTQTVHIQCLLTLYADCPRLFYVGVDEALENCCEAAQWI
jgi:hypothetical protein